MSLNQGEATELLEQLVNGLPGGGEPRAGQIEMAQLVTNALDNRSQLAVKAGTGTGKSLALLAAIAATGRRTIIATATKALQDQYVHKELPHLESVAPLDWAVLKGRANYACKLRMAEARIRIAGEPTEQEALFDEEIEDEIEDSPDPGESQHLPEVFEWAQSTITGDLSELPFELKYNEIDWIATGPQGCPGAKLCAHGDDCFAEKAIERAREARVVLVNTALLGADLTAESGLLGEADALVIDEAHVAEDILSSAFGAEIHPRDLAALDRQIRGAVKGDERKDLRAALDDCEARLTRELDLLEGESYPDGLPEGGRLKEVLTDTAKAVADAQAAARRSGKDDSGNAAAETLKRTSDRLAQALTQLLNSDEDDALFIESGSRRLKRVPIDVAAVLEKGAWKDLAVVLTSATLPSELPGRLGLQSDSVYTDVGSPFNYREVGLLYVPALLADQSPKDRTPNNDSWFEEAWDEAAEIINAAEGRTLFLCTSHRNAQAFAEEARSDLEWPVLAQGDAPKNKLLAEFADDEHSVLFGTMGLWQGVDVVGTSLSCLIVDKLPFPRPDDPMWQARAKHNRKIIAERDGTSIDDAGYKSFLNTQVPYSAAMLSQGVGRLIRSSTDRGLVMVLDPRLAEKAYRKQILAEIPPFRRTRNQLEATRHLRSSLGLEVDDELID